MNKVIEEKIINILRSGDIVNNAISLPLNEKLDILKEVRNRKNYYYELLVEELSKAHKKLISKEETDYIASHLADFKDYDFTRICFTYEMDFSPAFDNIFIQAYKQTGDVSYIPFISDPVGYVEDDFYAWDFLNDEQLEKVLLSGKAKYRRDYLIKCFSNDYYKEKYLTKLKESYERANIIESFESDELKIKNLNKVNADDRGNVIASFKSDELKKKYLNVFTKNKGSIINSFESDEDKIAYFNHFSLSLNSDDYFFIVCHH